MHESIFSDFFALYKTSKFAPLMAAYSIIEYNVTLQ